ncbi:RND superfamily putative drug exporter [Nocardioides albertanoniae]|uniref:RND superfamily putative drug exporter n=1 Tax=Nocardioides albertanoniae TaxID=1175486 RepID=A0A543A516_9ACTN|nr:MMPL family transporter [Nocardioides albertanoniae]TQL67638.1 RND superfamily putative drug exporter [Nocardioides albertanoniae]
MKHLARLQTGRISSLVVLAVAVLALGALFALLPTTSNDSAPPSSAPDDADSSRVARLLKAFPDADQSLALVVVATGDGSAFSAEQTAYLEAAVAGLAAESVAPQAVRPQLNEDRSAAMIAVPVEGAGGESEAIVEQADRLREIATEGRPDGVDTYLSGAVGFQADTVNAFAGTDVRLLLVTAGVVALLLILTYRSPVLWLVPLLVVATGDGLARFVVGAIAERFDIAVDASIMGILSVLVFGAGTNYALLLIARYREGLLAHEDRRVAMREAVAGAGPAILASGGTVVLSLLMLLFASLSGNRALGLACAIGIAIALAMALLVLPAAVLVCGRGLFWPFVPRPGAERTERPSFWGRVGRGVRRRPATIAAATVVVLGILAVGLLGARIGLSQTEQLLGDPESVQGERVATEAFGSDYGTSLTVLAPDDQAAPAVASAKTVTGVGDATVSGAAEGWTRIMIAVEGGSQTDEAFSTIRDLRETYADDATLDGVLVGGPDASALDENDADARDRNLIIPLIVLVVFLVLVVLLRSLLAPVLLILTVLATFFASLGAGNLLFQNLLGFPAFDNRVVLYAFLFLVALGVDYNIFLTTRAREERARLGTRDGMQEALSVTGGVITSAGIVLAAVFVVLGILPVVALAQIGTIVCIGVLLDTLVVRTLLVPALAFVLGERFWWPARHVKSRVNSPR